VFVGFDPVGRPVIADCVNHSVRVLRQQPDGTWSEQIVAEQIIDDQNVGNLAVSPVGKACIAYFDNRQVKVARADLPSDPTAAAEWTIQTADADGTASGTPTIKFSTLGEPTPHLAYFDPAKLRLLKRTHISGNSNVFQDSMEATITTWTTEGARNDSAPKVKPQVLRREMLSGIKPRVEALTRTQRDHELVLWN
jgi:hypothetical protein